MDEPQLRRYVQTMSKRLLQKLPELPSMAEERIRFVFSQPESLEPMLLTETVWPQKDAHLGKRNREDGNAAFQAGNLELALLLYTEALRYSPVDPDSLEGEDFYTAAANRSATLFQLKRFDKCLQDIELAIEAGYPIISVYKLYIRQCKCLLEMSKIVDAQKAFDQAVDAIDRSGLKKGMRKNLAVDLQEAFINLAKCVEEDAKDDPPAAAAKSPGAMPEWSQIKQPHPKYPAASSAVSIRHDPVFGRHVVAKRDIAVGEIIFHEKPIVSLLMQEEDTTVEACHHCFSFFADACPMPCPTCSTAVFCSLNCRREALASYHVYECRLGSFFRDVKLDKLPLIMLAVRAVTQRPATFFLQNRDKFSEHNVQNGVDAGEDDDNQQIFRSDDYKNLFNLVTHSDRREPADVSTKTVFAAFLLRCLKSVHYFDCCENEEDDVLFIGKVLLHFLECFQFNTHMVECVYENRLIAQDAETRIWKDAAKFSPGEFVETVRLGGAIYPTLANVNHSCDPNLILLNWGNRAVAIANRSIAAGEQIFDTYGAVYYHMSREERRAFLQGSHWFLCSCAACTNDWPIFSKLPREYLKLPGTHFKYKRCNRKELQKDVEKLKKQIRQNVLEGRIDDNRAVFAHWMALLDELLFPPHQDYVNVRRGMRNCLWLQSPNTCRVREDEALREKKAAYKEGGPKSS